MSHVAMLNAGHPQNGWLRKFAFKGIASKAHFLRSDLVPESLSH